MATNLSDKNVQFSEVIVAMVPLPQHSHVNQLFILACFIASHNIPVHFLCLSDQIQDLKLRVEGSLMVSNVHFNDLLVPTETQDPEDTGDGLPSMIVFLKKLYDPISRICLELSTNAKKLVIITDIVIRRSIEEVHSLIPNLESHIFNATSAFTKYSMFRQCIDNIVVIDEDHDKMVQQMQDEFPSPESWIAFMAKVIKLEYEWELSSGLLMNSCREVEGKYLDLLANEYTHKKPLWAVDPFHMLLESHNSSNTTRHECLEFLDKQDVNSVIFVSFGTNTTFSQEQVNELALGLELSNHRFIWVLREADKNMDTKALKEKYGKMELPEGFEERVEGRGMVVRNWVPQLEILGHSSTGGFLSHCGWNSCLESISMGVPIAAWPNNADQPYNAVFVTSVLKVGISARSWAQREELVTVAVVEKAVKTLMGTPEGEEMRRRAVELSNKIKGSDSHGGLARKEMESFISYITR